MEPLTLKKAAESVRIAADKLGYKACYVGLNSGDFDLIMPADANTRGYPRSFSHNGDVYYDAENTVKAGDFTIMVRVIFNLTSLNEK